MITCPYYRTFSETSHSRVYSMNIHWRWWSFEKENAMDSQSLDQSFSWREGNAWAICLRNAKLCQVTGIHWEIQFISHNLYQLADWLFQWARGAKNLRWIGSAVACGLTEFFKIFCLLFHRLEKVKAVRLEDNKKGCLTRRIMKYMYANLIRNEIDATYLQHTI